MRFATHYVAAFLLLFSSLWTWCLIGGGAALKAAAGRELHPAGAIVPAVTLMVGLALFVGWFVAPILADMCRKHDHGLDYTAWKYTWKVKFTVLLASSAYLGVFLISLLLVEWVEPPQLLLDLLLWLLG